MFNPNTLAQMAVFFVARAPRGAINRMKLMKIMYFADRAFMRRHGVPISFDDMVSMLCGPVLAHALRLSYGKTSGEASRIWNQWMCRTNAPREDVVLKRAHTRDDLDHLSDAALAVLQSVWRKFGAMTQWQLRDYAHNPKNCPEWQDPKHAGVNSIMMDEQDVLRALGFAEREAAERADKIKSLKSMEAYVAPESRAN